MATSTDYDAPRASAAEPTEDGLVALTARRDDAQSAAVDTDEAELAAGFEALPTTELDEDLMVAVVPIRADEFRCDRCFLVHHRGRHAGLRGGKDICVECAD